jgi:hypothetical protein
MKYPNDSRYPYRCRKVVSGPLRTLTRFNRHAILTQGAAADYCIVVQHQYRCRYPTTNERITAMLNRHLLVIALAAATSLGSVAYAQTSSPATHPATAASHAASAATEAKHATTEAKKAEAAGHQGKAAAEHHRKTARHHRAAANHHMKAAEHHEEAAKKAGESAPKK